MLAKIYKITENIFLMKRAALKLSILFFAFFSLNLLFAQEEDNKLVKRQSMKDRKKELAEKKEKQKADDAAAMDELKRMHYENQDKKTQKRMKQAMKKANSNNTGKRGFSLRNWFSKKNRY